MAPIPLPTQAEPALSKVSKVVFQAVWHLILPAALGTGRPGSVPISW